MAKKKGNDCPCGSGESYARCCGWYIDDGVTPETPEQLMRSRYTAYTMEDEVYLLDSWHTSTRPSVLFCESERPVKWVELSIVTAIEPWPSDLTATVEFTAHYKVMGKLEHMHERSKFVRENGCWFYLNGQPA